MAKRTASTELTDRNWDQEEEPEEVGEAIFFLFPGLRILRPKFLHFRKKIKFYFLLFYFLRCKKLPDEKKYIFSKKYCMILQVCKNAEMTII